MDMDSIKIIHWMFLLVAAWICFGMVLNSKTICCHCPFDKTADYTYDIGIWCIYVCMICHVSLLLLL